MKAGRYEYIDGRGRKKHIRFGWSIAEIVDTPLKAETSLQGSTVIERIAERVSMSESKHGAILSSQKKGA